jgi:hypothetical protein
LPCRVDDSGTKSATYGIYSAVPPQRRQHRVLVLGNGGGDFVDVGHRWANTHPMFPQTPAATAALSVATHFYSPALLNHCIRSYLWGTMYAAAHRIAFDDELYYVSALLHDIGLTEPFDSHRLAFEEAGGDLAWVFRVAAGWSADRAARATEIIVLHMRSDVSADADPSPTFCKSRRAGR